MNGLLLLVIYRNNFYVSDSLATLATAAISTSTPYTTPVNVKKDLLLGSSPVVSSTTDSAEAVANIKMELQNIKQVVIFFCFSFNKVFKKLFEL